MKRKISKNLYDAVFFKDPDPNEDDDALFLKMPPENASPNEKKFFEEMKKKVYGEFAPSADLILCEDNNPDEIYIVRYYFREFRIGRGQVNARFREETYTLSLAEALESDMFGLLDRHITLLEWLRENDFIGIDYEGNYALH